MMAIIRRTVMVIALLLLANVHAYPQKVWTLKDCIDYALAHNLNVKQSEVTTEISKNETLRNKAGLLPTLNGTASHSYNFGRSVDPFSYTFTNEEIRSTNLSLNGSLVLFNGFQLQNSLKQSQLEYMASMDDLKKIRNDISLNVASAYLQMLYAREQLNISSARVDEAVRQRDRAKLMADAGTMTRGNLLDAESQLANEEVNRITAENILASARLTLMQLLELETSADFQIEEPKADLPDAVMLTGTPEQIYQKAEQTLPEIRAADIRIQSAEKSLAIARGAYYPRLSLFGSIGSGYSSATQRLLGVTPNGYVPSGDVTANGDVILTPSFITSFERTPFGTQLDQNLSKSFGISLNIPIFNGLSTYTGVRRAKLTLQNTKYASDLTRKQVYKSIQQAYVDAASAQKKYAAATSSVTAQEEAYNYADKRFNAGLTSSLEFLTATNLVTKARIDLIQAKYDFIFRLKVLDFYAGNPLTF